MTLVVALFFELNFTPRHLESENAVGAPDRGKVEHVYDDLSSSRKSDDQQIDIFQARLDDSTV